MSLKSLAQKAFGMYRRTRGGTHSPSHGQPGSTEEKVAKKAVREGKKFLRKR